MGWKTTLCAGSCDGVALIDNAGGLIGATGVEVVVGLGETRIGAMTGKDEGVAWGCNNCCFNCSERFGLAEDGANEDGPAVSKEKVSDRHQGNKH